MWQSPYFWIGFALALVGGGGVAWGLGHWQAARLLAFEAAQGLAGQAVAYVRAHPDAARPLIADVYAQIPALLRRYVSEAQFTEWVLAELARQ